ncbi:hypothetical protein [Novosphingobium sp. BL-52-GroH]|uniref:hypothetical protein n=1 Tax=Novosphingobium sp. BL-52-GroH TaxID=3349877 RepID=UPI00384AFAD7
MHINASSNHDFLSVALVHKGFASMPDEMPAARLPLAKRTVVFASAFLTIVGVFDALANVPVVSGCAFYADCRNEEFRQPPGKMGRDIP